MTDDPCEGPSGLRPCSLDGCDAPAFGPLCERHRPPRKPLARTKDWPTPTGRPVALDAALADRLERLLEQDIGENPK